MRGLRARAAEPRRNRHPRMNIHSILRSGGLRPGLSVRSQAKAGPPGISNLKSQISNLMRRVGDRRSALEEAAQLTRRDFLTTSASGLGTLALASLFAQDGLLSTAQAGTTTTGPMKVQPPHFAPKAKA